MKKKITATIKDLGFSVWGLRFRVWQVALTGFRDLTIMV